MVCLVAKSAAWHVTETLRTTLTEAVDMVADSVGYLVSKGRRVFLDAEHFFDGYRDDPGFSTDVLRAAAARRGRGPGAVRHQRRQPALRGGAGGRRGPRPGRHRPRLPFPQRLRLRGRQLPPGRPDGRHPGAGLRQRLRRADRQRRPDRRRPRPDPEDGGSDHRRRAAGPPYRRVAPHRRGGQRRARPPPAVRGRLGLRPQGRAAHQCHRPLPRRLRARRPRARSATAPVSW